MKFLPSIFQTLCWSELGPPNRRPSLCFIVLTSRLSAVCGISVLAPHFWQLGNVHHNAPVPAIRRASSRRASEAERRERLGLWVGDISLMPNGTLDGFNHILDFD